MYSALVEYSFVVIYFVDKGTLRNIVIAGRVQAVGIDTEVSLVEQYFHC